MDFKFVVRYLIKNYNSIKVNPVEIAVNPVEIAVNPVEIAVQQVVSRTYCCFLIRKMFLQTIIREACNRMLNVIQNRFFVRNKNNFFISNLHKQAQ